MVRVFQCARVMLKNSMSSLDIAELSPLFKLFSTFIINGSAVPFLQ